MKDHPTFDRFSVLLLLVWISGGLLWLGVLRHLASVPFGILLLCNWAVMVLALMVLFMRRFSKWRLGSFIGGLLLSLVIFGLYSVTLFFVWDTLIYFL